MDLNDSSHRLNRKRIKTTDEDEEDEADYKKKPSIGFKILEKMNFEGKGLGKFGQGVTDDIEVQNPIGRRGLGHQIHSRIEIDFNESEEVKTIEETPEWCSKCDNAFEKTNLIDDSWIIIDKPKEKIEDETRYCSSETLLKMLEGKNVFDHMSDRDLNFARLRANPYENVKGAFFQNRAAMKMANLDKIYGWLLSGETVKEERLSKNPLDLEIDELHRKNNDREKPLFYFADVCAGPGGFTEYLLWRKSFYNAKGFGFTLIGDCDFNLNKFTAASPMYFHPFYGVERDGDVMNPDNLVSLQQFVGEGTNGDFCDLVMCDGGFNVSGKENIQEILSKRLYLCQFIAGLSLCRQSTENTKGGNYVSFENISLHKCHTSRPANSERYIVCKNLKPWGGTIIKDYLMSINKKLNDFERKGLSNVKDILEIVPEEVIYNDEQFYNYIVNHNENVAQRQTFYLNKYAKYAQNSTKRDKDQETIRNECLQYWEIPKRPKIVINNHNNPGKSYNDCCEYMIKLLHSNTFCPTNIEKLPKSVEDTFFKVASHEAKRRRMEEIRFNFTPILSERGILSSSRDGVFRLLSSGKFVKIAELNHIIPFDSFVYYEKTPLFKKAHGRMIEAYSSVDTSYRIIDAAIISGDYIADEPYDKRMASIKKMCQAVSKSKGESKRSNENMSRREKELNEKISNNKNSKSRFPKKPPTPLDNEDTILASDLYKISDIDNILNNIEIHCYNQKYMAFLKIENDFYIPISGLRFFNILKKYNQWYYSESNKNLYMVNFEKKQTYLEGHVANNPKIFYNSFYDMFLMESKNFANVFSWQWSINNNTSIKTLIENDCVLKSYFNFNSLSDE
ncbi:Cap-specific mRNA (nucleoside-2'-O-)-methyltransferase 1 [Strongyloides ratti]|uniref:Cap-specific mRNA (nucleoside-2'-O-)-methyltransferase 1 n=1 Tax=Strongyloides ratti TaxID=34506 RepID=A0A090MW55_STRRB|nr:Cap-specific mRNA (nucleoside-2'-O-)-methyltransferase 1 [Strongyloides ratti]CEF63448.1 Cap-specific mRNA (nucleoside-2'-O-)-methyltransferase 1 [Strongyloides ratti]